MNYRQRIYLSVMVLGTLGGIVSSLNCESVPIQMLIKNSDAVGVINAMKSLDRLELERAAELAHEILDKRSKLRRNWGEWASGIATFIGFSGLMLFEVLSRNFKNDIIEYIEAKIPASRMQKEEWDEEWAIGRLVTYGLQPFFLALGYGYWWRGPRLKLERAKIIVDALDLELGVVKDPCDG